MNILVVAPSVPQCIKFLQECRVWTSSRPAEQTKGVRFEYTAREAMFFHVGKSMIATTTPRLLDTVRGREFSLAYLCGDVEAEKVVDVCAVMGGDHYEIACCRHLPDAHQVMSGLVAIESKNHSAE